MVDALLAASTGVNDTKTYNNGVKVVPSYLLKPVGSTRPTGRRCLIDSGYYKKTRSIRLSRWGGPFEARRRPWGSCR